jgi:predicted ribosomally synthesized peptide with SipW-like signal peptide
MKANDLRISRRQVLAGLGTIGLASAGAGLGTSAYFNDREAFVNNSLEAGEFDLKVDWQQEYYGPDVDELYGSAGLPYVNAFPDADGDGKQDTVMSRTDISTADPSLTAGEVEEMFRAQFADMPDDYADPVVSLDDVKPGDSGCLNMSLHLFDNPGYIWMGGGITGESENGQTEPEADVDSTDGGAGELADSIEATLWYDDDNNCEVSSGIQGDGDVVIVFDVSGSMDNEAGKFQGAKDGAKQLVDALGSNANVGLVTYSGSASVPVGLGSGGAHQTTVKNTIDGLTASGSTNMEAAVQAARDELVDNGSSSTQIMVFLTNGTPTAGGDPVDDATSAKNSDGIEIYTIAYGSTANASLLQQMSSDPDNQYSYVAAQIAAIEQVFSQIGQVIAGEEVIVSGTLRDVLDYVAGGVALDGNRLEADRQCFVNSTTQHVALKWEVPTSVENEIQSDTLSFDIAFEAEQCRHNDGLTNPFDQTA